MESREKELKFCGGIDTPPKLGEINPDEGFKYSLLQLMAFHGAFSIEDAIRPEDEYQDIPGNDVSFVNGACQDFDSRTLDVAGLTYSKISSWRRTFLKIVNMLVPPIN